jgi:hypothetical protein
MVPGPISGFWEVLAKLVAVRKTGVSRSICIIENTSVNGCKETNLVNSLCEGMRGYQEPATARVIMSMYQN